ncbi:MAG: DNA polymerase IV [Candidatus Micrarchaeia archaeon]
MLYVDMDYFYAACEELRHPELRGKAFVVGTSPPETKESGVIQTCTYPARKFGIKSGMSTAFAFKLKPDLIYLQADEPYYEGISQKIFDILRSYKYKMEILSVDEAALDLGDSEYDKAKALGFSIKNRIKNEMNLDASIGISYGKVFAKMACDASKPNGLLLIKKEEILDFIKDKPISALPGIGRKTGGKLKSMNINTIGELAKANPLKLIEWFGSYGSDLYQQANGIDNSRIEESSTILSLSREKVIPPNFDPDALYDILKPLAEDLVKDAISKKLMFKTISVKAVFQDYSTSVKSITLNNYSSSLELVLKAVRSIIPKLVSETRPARKIGVRISSLIDVKGQKTLF